MIRSAPYLRRSLLRSPLSPSSSKQWLLAPASTTATSWSVPATAAAAKRCVWTQQQEEQFRRDGLLDERGLTVFETLHEMQRTSCAVYRDNELFGTYAPSSESFEWMTFGDFDQKVETCRIALQRLGVGANDKIAIISNNRWEWACIACAGYGLNAAIVPLYEAQLEKDWTYILNDSGASVLFCATKDVFDRVQRHVLPSTPAVQATLCLDTVAASEEDDGGGEPAPYTFAAAMASAESAASATGHAPTPDDLANLIYTSGTTGKPKGVELVHSNFVTNVKGGTRSVPTDPKDFCRESDRSLAFLPWAHSYGQTCELWNHMAHGASMGICRGVPMILEDLALVQPTVLYAVPTLYKKIYDGVHNLMENASPLRKKLMQSALHLGQQQAAVQHGWREPLGTVDGFKHMILDSLVLSKIRGRFGGRLRHGFVAGAATPVEVMNFMDAIGIAICEGYGLTETSPIIALNTPEFRKVGSVGRAIGGVQVHIIDDEGKPVAVGQEGEICCTGPNIMRGYYKNPQATDEVISLAPDGTSRMFHTGDLGRMDEDGWVMVTGRIKEQYKLENGKYVVPTPIEEAVGLSRFVHQVVLAGANRPYNVALIVPEWSTIRSELDKPEGDVSEEDLVNDPAVHELIDKDIQRLCDHLKKFEIPQAFAFVAPFTAANGQLTPKMSIRRHKVIQSYGDVISHLYGDDPVVAPAADSTGAKEQPTEEEKKAA